jgi:hypothetical protein
MCVRVDEAGATTRPVASTRRVAAAPASAPTRTMRDAADDSDVGSEPAPAPSTTRPPVMITS